MKLKWTYEKCKEEALKYSSKKEFETNSNAYFAAHNRGWIDEICKHMNPIGNRFNRALYAFEFPDNSVYVGLTYNIEKRRIEHFSSKTSSVYKHMLDTSIIPDFVRLSDYLPAIDAQKLEGIFVEKYILEKWTILNRAKTGHLGASIIKWTYENCKTESLKYKNRTSFMKSASGAYKSASINGWLDEICSHMEIKMKKKYWTIEKCAKEALKYENRNQFKINSCDAYSFANRNKLLDEICGHMKRYPNNFKKKTIKI